MGGAVDEIWKHWAVWDVRALFLDRELAEDFVSMDVTLLRLRSLAVEVPPWDFREEAGQPMELSEEGLPQWTCRFDEQCEARFVQGSGNARAAASQTHGDGVSVGDHQSVSSVPCGLWGQNSGPSSSPVIASSWVLS